jgi:hypothetical protein
LRALGAEHDTLRMEEKRAFPRFKINQIIAYGPNREENVFAEIINISRNGLSCSSAQIIEPMTNVYLMMHVPSPPEGNEGERAVRCEGYVSHSHIDAGLCVFGVKITSVYEDDAAVFEAYLASLENEARIDVGENRGEGEGEGGAGDNQGIVPSGD